METKRTKKTHKELVEEKIRFYSVDEDFRSEWTLGEIYIDDRKCDLCGHKIKICSEIKNKRTGKILVIGSDCAELVISEILLTELYEKLIPVKAIAKELAKRAKMDEFCTSGRIIDGKKLSNVEWYKLNHPEYFRK